MIDLMLAYEELVGPEALARATAGLSAPARHAMANVTPLSWVPVEVLGELVDRVAVEAREEAEALLDRAVRRATERTFTTLWRILLRVTSTDALLSRTPLFYSKSRNTGRLEARVVGPGQAELALTGWPGVSARHVRTLAVSIGTVVELAGRKNVKVAWARTKDGAAYQLTWSD